MELEMTRADWPEGFRFGAATSAYQIEGSSFGGCGPSHWDAFAAAGRTDAGADGAVACDHYHRWAEDLDLIAGAGLDFYRFSTSWARVQPDGKGPPNPEGLAFYDRLVDGMLARGITPMLTLHHWELPQPLAEAEGWRNRDTARRFGDFADIVIRRLGDRVREVGTLNEPWCIAWLSHHDGHHAPGLTDLGAAARAMHHVLVAHAEALSALRAFGDLSCGIYCNYEWAEPASEADEDTAARYHGIYNDWYARALFHGAYPEIVLEGIADLLPTGWQEDMAAIRRPLDWFGVNYYTRKILRRTAGAWPAYAEVEGPLPKTDMDWEIYPDGLHQVLTWLKDTHTGDLPLIVSENGLATPGTEDRARIAYLRDHMAACRRAISDGVPLTGYTVWSLLDNYEWAKGYAPRFGLIHVDYDTQTRTPKASYHALRRALHGDV